MKPSTKTWLDKTCAEVLLVFIFPVAASFQGDQKQNTPSPRDSPKIHGFSVKSVSGSWKPRGRTPILDQKKKSKLGFEVLKKNAARAWEQNLPVSIGASKPRGLDYLIVILQAIKSLPYFQLQDFTTPLSSWRDLLKMQPLLHLPFSYTKLP